MHCAIITNNNNIYYFIKLIYYVSASAASSAIFIISESTKSCFTLMRMLPMLPFFKLTGLEQLTKISGT